MTNSNKLLFAEFARTYFDKTRMQSMNQLSLINNRISNQFSWIESRKLYL